MLITRETDYALRILRSLSSGEFLTVREISDKELLPQKFAYKIVKKLQNAGLIQIMRGINGGCRLAADLKTVSLYDLSGAIEGNSRISSCMNPTYECEWRKSHNGTCTIHMQLAKIQKAVDEEFRKTSLHGIIFGEE